MSFSNFCDLYKKFFSVKEWENNNKIYLLLWIYAITTFVTFLGWNGLGITSPLYNDCWPHFQNCHNIISFVPLPYGFSESLWYLGLFCLIGFYCYFLVKKDFLKAHMSLLLLLLWKGFVAFFIYHNAGNFEYYDLFLGFVLLFLPKKEFFLGLSFLIFYVLAATIKIHDSWILGTYFTSLKTGAPLFNDEVMPIFTNMVILMQIVGAWFLFSKNKLLQRIAFTYFLLFHLYSGIIVAYRYIITAIPLLIVLFAAPYDWREEIKNSHLRSFIPGFIFIGFLFAVQFIGIRIPGDQKLTLEGNNYGFYMFESNHQCRSVFVYTKEGSPEEFTSKNQNINARNRCDPFREMKKIQTNFCSQKITPLRWTFDHSINGNPFYRIVDEKNPCSLDYKPFVHNTWIKTEQESPARVGYPNKNYYYGSRGVPLPKQIVFETEKIFLNPLQKFLKPHTESIKNFYWFLWTAGLMSATFTFTYYIYNERKRNKK